MAAKHYDFSKPLRQGLWNTLFSWRKTHRKSPQIVNHCPDSKLLWERAKRETANGRNLFLQKSAKKSAVSYEHLRFSAQICDSQIPGFTERAENQRKSAQKSAKMCVPGPVSPFCYAAPIGAFFCPEIRAFTGLGGARFLRPFPKSLVTEKCDSNTKLAVNSR